MKRLNIILFDYIMNSINTKSVFLSPINERFSLKNIQESTIDSVKEVIKNVSNKVEKVREAEPIKYPTFIQTNTTISRFVVIILLLILFTISFKLGVFLITKLFSINRSPNIIEGIVKSDKLTIVSSNPNVDGSVPILRSINENNGIEYSWSCWIFIEDQYLNKDTKNRRIFSKGEYYLDKNDETKFYNNSPGLYLRGGNGADTNIINVVFNTYSLLETNTIEIIEVEDIPIEKWVNIIFTLNNKKVNIYINGILKKTHMLKNVPRQNYYDTFIGDNNGFGGYISNLKYYDYSINDLDIQKIMIKGPDIRDKKNDKIKYNAPFLSMSWYYN